MRKVIYTIGLIIVSIQLLSAQMSFKENSVKFQSYKQISGNLLDGHFLLGGGFGMMGPSIQKSFEDDIMGTKYNMIGFGGQINMLYFTKPGNALGLNIGYYGFNRIVDYLESYNSVTRREISSSIINLMVQHLYVFGEGKVKPFVGFGEGVSLIFESCTDKYTSINYGEDISNYSNEYPFLNITPNLGINTEITDRLYMNFTVRFIFGMNTKISSAPEAFPELFYYTFCFNLDMLIKL
ncbi:hypothetical protein ACFLRZ_00390 [Bacteroidota bacterium]